MFELKSKKEIGYYLKDKIEKEYGKPSEFCRAYLKISHSENGENAFENLKNRISSILNGKKDIQLYDFPVFTKLLALFSKSRRMFAMFVPAAGIANATGFTIWRTKPTRCPKSVIPRRERKPTQTRMS